MLIDFYTPKNKILQKYIEGYYFIAENEKSDEIRYWTFPNNYSILTVSQNTHISQNGNVFKISKSSEKNITVDLVLSYRYPLEIIYEKPLNEITIYFKPLGLNHFVENLQEDFKLSLIHI